MKKNFLIEITSPIDGSVVGIWDNMPVRFVKELNAGIGECVIVLPEKIDYYDNSVKEGNNVEIRMSDIDTVDIGNQTSDQGTKIIYRGYISQIDREINNGNEKITVRVLGHYTKLSLDIIKSGEQTTLYSTAVGFSTSDGDWAQGDIGLLMRELIDLYRINNPNDSSIGYYYEDIPDADVDVSLIFKQKTYRDVMDMLKDLAPAGIYWYADEFGMIKFRAVDSEPKHNFIFGRHFSDIRIERSIEKIRNVLLLWNGETGLAQVYKAYEDSNSIVKYGRRVETINNYGIGDENTADEYGAKFLAENKNPDIKITVKIFDNNVGNFGYDIESINPGDTCCFTNFDLNFAGEIFNDNMIITRVEYTPDYAIIEVEQIKSGLIDQQNNQNKKIRELNTSSSDFPTTYTT